MAGHWILARTQAGRERWAGQNVLNQGHQFYLPTFAEQIIKNGQPEDVIKPLFSRYLFVYSHMGQWRFLLGTFGVTGVVMMGGEEPSVVPEKVIEELKAHEGERGIIELPGPRFQIGSHVRIDRGSFKDFIGIYQGQTPRERERVLLNILGRETPVEVETSWLQAVGQ